MPQIVGYCAMILGICACLQKDDQKMRIIMSIMGVVITAHFYMLTNYTAASMTLLATSRPLLSLFERIKKYRHILVPIYILLSIGLAYTTYLRWFDLLPMIAAINGTIAFFYMSGFQLRLMMACGGILWLTHNILALSYGPAMMEMCLVSANLFTAYRLYQDKKKPPFNPEAQL